MTLDDFLIGAVIALSILSLLILIGGFGYLAVYG